MTISQQLTHNYFLIYKRILVCGHGGDSGRQRQEDLVYTVSLCLKQIKQSINDSLTEAFFLSCCGAQGQRTPVTRDVAPRLAVTRPLCPTISPWAVCLSSLEMGELEHKLRPAQHGRGAKGAVSK